jgi:signal transduction histidine kinase
MIDMHNGFIRVESKLGVGTMFTIIFKKGANISPVD